MLYRLRLRLNSKIVFLVHIHCGSQKWHIVLASSVVWYQWQICSDCRQRFVYTRHLSCLSWYTHAVCGHYSLSMLSIYKILNISTWVLNNQNPLADYICNMSLSCVTGLIPMLELVIRGWIFLFRFTKDASSSSSPVPHWPVTCSPSWLMLITLPGLFQK